MSGIRDLGTRNDSWNRDDSYFLREAPDHIVMEREQKENKILFSLLRRGILAMKAIFHFMDTGFFVKRERHYFDTTV